MPLWLCRKRRRRQTPSTDTSTLPAAVTAIPMDRLRSTGQQTAGSLPVGTLLVRALLTLGRPILRCINFMSGSTRTVPRHQRTACTPRHVLRRQHLLAAAAVTGGQRASAAKASVL